MKAGALFLAAVCIISGLIVLLGYFIPVPGLFELRAVLLDWSLSLAAVAAVVGVANLTAVHWRKLRTSPKDAVNSAVTIFLLVATTIVVVAFGPNKPASLWIFNHLLIPIEAGLMATLAVTLIFGVARIFHQPVSWVRSIFFVTVLFALISAVSWQFFDFYGITSLRSWLVNAWAVAGARGILLGVALGAVATGLRVLVGFERPYSR